jgi:hypothetical protein
MNEGTHIKHQLQPNLALVEEMECVDPIFVEQIMHFLSSFLHALYITHLKSTALPFTIKECSVDISINTYATTWSRFFLNSGLDFS